MRTCLKGCLFALSLSLAIAVFPSLAHSQEVLPILARVGPWPVASRLIGFQDRLWLVNSVKGKNHNSADLYSYDPAAGDMLYERHLFSQDAGRPVAAAGLLYWPFEDSRFSLGFGHFMVTDGTAWRFGTIPTARSFHTHAMTASHGRLFAATSAWRTALHVSADRGQSWRLIYDHPTPERRVTRIVELAALGDQAFGYLTSRYEQRLLRFDAARVDPAPGWPEDRSVIALTELDGHVYGLVREDGGAALWRIGDSGSERVAPPRADWPVRDLAAADDGLWAVTAEQAGGTVWHSDDGRDWQIRYRLAGGQPYEIAAFAEKIYVGGAGDDGRGILWGIRGPVAGRDDVPATLPQAAPLSDGRDWVAAGERLDRLLADPASYESHGRQLRDLVFELVNAGPPQEFFAERFRPELPSEEISLIGGNVQLPAAEFGRWLLLWAMTLADQGPVPIELIEAAWSTAPNRAEKYFAAAPGAMWAAGIIGQNDAPTITALVELLGHEEEPLWLRGDAIGALSALTGERFGYDVAAWQAWWAAARKNWPH